jgi:hypothetical protein
MEADFRPFLEIFHHFSFFALWMRHSASTCESRGVFVGDSKLPDEEVTESAPLSKSAALLKTDNVSETNSNG